MTTIVPLVHPLPPKPQSQARAPKLTDQLSEQRPSQVGPIRGPLARTQEKALELYDEHLTRRFPGPTLVEAPASKIIELPSEAPSPQVQSGPSKMNVNPPSVINTSILGESAKANDMVSLGDPEDWSMNNQSSGYDLYVHLPTLFHNSLTILAQCLTTCANVMATTRHFVASSSVSCMAQCERKFVLPASPIIENLCRCNKALCTTCKGKEAPHGHSYNDE